MLDIQYKKKKYNLTYPNQNNDWTITNISSFVK